MYLEESCNIVGEEEEEEEISFLAEYCPDIVREVHTIYSPGQETCRIQISSVQLIRLFYTLNNYTLITKVTVCLNIVSMLPYECSETNNRD